MNCPNCGTNNVDNASHCMACGSPMREFNSTAEQTNQNQNVGDKIKGITKASFFKPLCLGVVAIVAVIILISIFSSLLSGDRFVLRQNIFSSYKVDDTTHFTANGKEIYSTENYIRDTEYNLDRSIRYHIEYSENPYEDEDYEDEGGTLYYMTSKKCEATSITNAAYIKYVSDDGKIIYYTDPDGNIYQYSKGDKEGTKVDFDPETMSIEAYACSPNGKYLVFAVMDVEKSNDSTEVDYATYDGLTSSADSGSDDEEDYDVTTYIYSNGKTEILEGAENFLPLSVTDNGKKLYGGTYNPEKGETKVYSFVKNEKGENIVTLAGKMDSYTFSFNTDRTEMLFVNDGDTYLCRDFGTKQKLGKGTWTPVSSANAVALESFTDIFYRKYESSDEDYELKFIKNNLDIIDVKKFDGGAVSNDAGDTIYFSDGGDLYVVTESNMDESIKIASDISDVAFTEDGKYVYFINDDDELYVVKNFKADKKEKIKIDDAYSLYITSDEELIVKADRSDNTGEFVLYCCKGTKIEKIAEDVKSVSVYGNNLYYEDNYDAKESGDETVTLHIRKSGTKFYDPIEDVDY